MIRCLVQIVNQTNPMSKEEWELLYARLYFPTQFYDALYSLREGEAVDIPMIYEQALQYTKLLYNCLMRSTIKLKLNFMFLNG